MAVAKNDFAADFVERSETDAWVGTLSRQVHLRSSGFAGREMGLHSLLDSYLDARMAESRTHETWAVSANMYPCC